MADFLSLLKLRELKILFSQEPKLIEIKSAKNVIFVGDTHGDFVSSQKIIKKYLGPENKIIFLGDYVDRGPFSKQNIDFLLEMKLSHPEKIYLLQGNHEGYKFFPFRPADFWENLSKKEVKAYSSILSLLPLAVVAKEIIALHGVLPDIWQPQEINEILPPSQLWFQITWGDYYDKEGEYFGKNPLTGRPEFGKDHFFKIMQRLNKKVLIRSHQPEAPDFMFNDRCLTLFTSSFYEKTPRIAIFEFEKEIKTARDLEMIGI